jgi:hypothetical protein
MKRLVLVLSFLLLSTSFQFVPGNALQLKKPNVYFERERFDGGYLSLWLKDSFKDLSEFGAKNLSYECYVSSGNCTIFNLSKDESQNIWANISIENYVQGALVKVTVLRTFDKYINGLLMEYAQQSSVSVETLNPLPRPTRGEITSEPNGCSFQILNFDNRNDYYFKSPRWEISKSGRVRLFLLEWASPIFSYVSVTRKGHVTINAVETEHECRSSS